MPRWAIIVASIIGIGYFPLLPGTMASAVAALLYYFLPILQYQFILLTALSILFILGWIAAEAIIKSIDDKDPSFVVSDEVVGQWLALVSLIHHGELVFVLLSFSLFRFFDITKPFPVSWFNRKEGGIFVMLDDVVAGFYANITTHLLMWVVSK